MRAHGLPIDTIRQILNNVTYKPGTEFRLVERPMASGNWVLHVTVEVPDSRYVPMRPDGDRPTIRVTHPHQMPPLHFLRDRDDVLTQVREAIHFLELHEADEWIRFDGRMPFDPHATQEPAR